MEWIEKKQLGLHGIKEGILITHKSIVSIINNLFKRADAITMDCLTFYNDINFQNFTDK